MAPWPRTPTRKRSISMGGVFPTSGWMSLAVESFSTNSASANFGSFVSLISTSPSRVMVPPLVVMLVASRSFSGGPASLVSTATSLNNMSLPRSSLTRLPSRRRPTTCTLCSPTRPPSSAWPVMSIDCRTSAPRRILSMLASSCPPSRWKLMPWRSRSSSRAGAPRCDNRACAVVGARATRPAPSSSLTSRPVFRSSMATTRPCWVFSTPMVAWTLGTAMLKFRLVGVASIVASMPKSSTVMMVPSGFLTVTSTSATCSDSTRIRRSSFFAGGPAS